MVLTADLWNAMVKAWMGLTAGEAAMVQMDVLATEQDEEAKTVTDKMVGLLEKANLVLMAGHSERASLVQMEDLSMTKLEGPWLGQMEGPWLGQMEGPWLDQMEDHWDLIRLGLMEDLCQIMPMGQMEDH